MGLNVAGWFVIWHKAGYSLDKQHILKGSNALCIAHIGHFSKLPRDGVNQG